LLALRSASAGVFVLSDRAWTPSLISCSNSAYTWRCRATAVFPSNAAETISTLKCVSASGSPDGFPECPACMKLSSLIFRDDGARPAVSFDSILPNIGRAAVDMARRSIPRTRRARD